MIRVRGVKRPQSDNRTYGRACEVNGTSTGQPPKPPLESITPKRHTGKPLKNRTSHSTEPRRAFPPALVHCITDYSTGNSRDCLSHHRMIGCDGIGRCCSATRGRCVTARSWPLPS